jgi:hypothetical protein
MRPNKPMHASSTARAQEQAGADEQHERHRHLQHDQALAQEGRRAGDAAAARFDRTSKIDPRCTQGGQEAEDDPGQHADARQEPNTRQSSGAFWPNGSSPLIQ